MPGVPSNKACERCKKRHLKCDETRPSCQRCTNAGVECPGYVQTRKFIDQGASVRRRYAPYSETHPKPHASKPKETVASDHAKSSEGNVTPVPVDPGLMTRVDSGSSMSMAWGSPDVSQLAVRSTPTELAPTMRDTPVQLDGMADMMNRFGVQPVSAEIAGSDQHSASSRSNAPSSLSPSNAPAGGFAIPNHIATQLKKKPSNATLASSTSPSQRSEQEEFQDIFSELMTGTEHEIAFLTRHFSTTLGPWLDISDAGKFFSAYVPVRAIDDPCLKYAIAALAAKHLGRVKGAISPTGGALFTSPPTMEVYPNASQVDWFLKAANYYYMASSHINTMIADPFATVSTTAILESPIENVSRWLTQQLKQTGFGPPTEQPVVGTFWRKVEDLLAASTILTTYKLLDEAGDKWQSHLQGAKTAFDALLQICSNYAEVPQFSHGAAASFFMLARFDYLGAYFPRTSTYFDQDNLTLWRAAGLPIDEQGNLQLESGVSSRNPMMLQREDLAANSLIWLLNKVLNFLADTKRSQVEQWVGQPPSAAPSPTVASPRSQPTTTTWLRLCFEFQTWVEKMPETFRPCLRLDRPKDISKLPEISQMPFPEIFYGMTSCAAAMQQYHFGRLALLLNRPPDVISAPSTAFDRLQGYRELTKEVDYRCKEICGIALGRPQGGVRIYMTPLLFAVGQCFENPEERQIITDLLRGVEADLGWATGYQIQKLQTVWEQ
ncbi:putative C6 finger domain protein [Aspergillus clavatus NRRL 1]|uniref:C6 finger domain protein, putative n=1 Tax=Aspergillus clavatus (strain ATCC 1007 / CBS 513.65 / DSM 816 / NCTC 3887 / NRRL 1 / QM 1276 / 107) TaxID=344612 RepID=A1CUL8_ASPCL|nr:C6 finger domain protein, putative [Aspergillus clavatus NRRL 1]EAW07005.1 C6 finger domain protein, putative [Aspergillus clavatus NRRL 1]